MQHSLQQHFKDTKDSSWCLCEGKKYLFSCSIPDLIIEGSGLPSDGEDGPGVTPVIATPITSSAPPPNSALGTTTAAASSKRPLSSILADGSVGESVSPSSTVVSEGSAARPKKVPKSVAGDMPRTQQRSMKLEI